LNVANWTGALGQDHLNLGNYEKAKEFYSQCLLFSQENGIPFLEANCLQGLGVVYRMLSQKKSSDRNLQKALVLSRKLGDKVLQAGCLFQIGINLVEEDKFNKAQVNFEKSLQIFRKYYARSKEAMVLWQLGELYEREEPEKAFQYMSDALLIFEECGIPRDQEYITKLDKVKATIAS
jgi:tetratricopeptide (TPR) repeat protein